MAESRKQVVLWWCRRDLRLADNRPLFNALTSGHPVVPVFLFDRAILDDLPPLDRRVVFLHRELTALHTELCALGSAMEVRYGHVLDLWRQLLADYTVQAVYAGEDYEPYATQRDAAVRELLAAHHVPLHLYKDHVLFHKEEVLTATGNPYGVFSPYKKRWLNGATEEDFAPADCAAHFENFFAFDAPPEIPSLEAMGFKDDPDFQFPARTVSDDVLKRYADRRNFPGEPGTSRLGLHLRFGTVSVRALARQAQALPGKGPETFLSELIWRDFYSQVLYHHPQVVDTAYKPIYDTVPWRDTTGEAAADWAAWCEGRTGYPLVDAGMRQLNETGYMHNRVRMVVASFLTKHLLIDWRLGEAYFAEKLLDFDLASNNGGWQWAAGSGTDAAPYFRVFNPASQHEKFDRESKYVKQWVPEFGTPKYPAPIVEHALARDRCLKAYKSALQAEQKAV